MFSFLRKLAVWLKRTAEPNGYPDPPYPAANWEDFPPEFWPEGFRKKKKKNS
jgi:hypothetical protein